MNNQDASYVMNQSLQVQVKLFHLNKTQTESDVKIQEGKIVAFSQIINLYENVITEETTENTEFLELTKLSLESAKDELLKLQALALLHKNLYDNLEQSLVDLDIQQFTRDIVMGTEKETEDRRLTGKCCLKRLGKVKFPCDNKVKPNERYCEQHKKDFS